jgi:hypothetical protein
VLVGVAAIAGLLGCSDSKDPSTAPGASGPSTASATTTTFDATHPTGGRLESAARSAGFKPSQCYTVDGFTAGVSLEPTQVHAISCDVPHRLEVDAVLQHPSAKSSPYPGADALGSFAEDQCLEQFRGYVGRSYDVSGLDITDIRPTERSWNAGDRTVVCFVYDQDFNDLTGSVKGSNR